MHVSGISFTQSGHQWLEAQVQTRGELGEIETHLDATFDVQESPYVKRCIDSLSLIQIDDKVGEMVWAVYRNYWGTTSYPDITQGNLSQLKQHWRVMWAEITDFGNEYKNHAFIALACSVDWDREHGMELLCCDGKVVMAVEGSAHPSRYLKNLPPN